MKTIPVFRPVALSRILGPALWAQTATWTDGAGIDGVIDSGSPVELSAGVDIANPPPDQS